MMWIDVGLYFDGIQKFNKKGQCAQNNVKEWDYGLEESFTSGFAD